MSFSAREIRYLQSLPAVERVSADRIQYTEEFKRDCIRRYNAGESPAQIFRRAGLDSSLIGYKRIERCIARWRRTVDPLGDGDAKDNSAKGQESARVGTATAANSEFAKSEVTTNYREAATQEVATTTATAAAAATTTATTVATQGAAPSVFDIPESKRWAEPVTPPIDATKRSDPAVGDARLANYDASSLLMSRGNGGDIYGLIIMQQARRIDILEREIDQLRDQLRDELR